MPELYKLEPRKHGVVKRVSRLLFLIALALLSSNLSLKVEAQDPIVTGPPCSISARVEAEKPVTVASFDAEIDTWQNKQVTGTMHFSEDHKGRFHLLITIDGHTQELSSDLKSLTHKHSDGSVIQQARGKVIVGFDYLSPLWLFMQLTPDTSGTTPTGTALLQHHASGLYTAMATTLRNPSTLRPLDKYVTLDATCRLTSVVTPLLDAAGRITSFRDTHFGNYKAASDLTLPYSVTESIGTTTLSHLTITAFSFPDHLD